MVRALELPLEPEFDELVVPPEVDPPEEPVLPEEPEVVPLEDADTEVEPLAELVLAVADFFDRAGS